jgi:hypothetical protein
MADQQSCRLTIITLDGSEHVTCTCGWQSVDFTSRTETTRCHDRHEQMHRDAQPGASTSAGNAEPKFRWNSHDVVPGAWCRWSLCAAPDRLAASDDKRCPDECPDSTIEEIPALGIWVDTSPGPDDGED